MNKQFYHISMLLISTLLCLSFASAAVAMAPCVKNPNANTLMLQAAIDAAQPGSTLVLPSGVCVLAKCDIAQGHICYGPTGLRHSSALYIGQKSKLTLVGAGNGTSVLKLDPNPPGAPG